MPFGNVFAKEKGRGEISRWYRNNGLSSCHPLRRLKGKSERTVGDHDILRQSRKNAARKWVERE